MDPVTPVLGRECEHDFRPVSPDSLTLYCIKCRALSRPEDDAEGKVTWTDG